MYIYLLFPFLFLVQLLLACVSGVWHIVPIHQIQPHAVQSLCPWFNYGNG